MKKLNATDIKGIIEERGSNVFDVIIDVPKNIFAYPEFQQGDIVVESILGYKLKSRIVKSILFNGISNKPSSLNVKATLEFSEAAVSEMFDMENSISEVSANACFIDELLSIEDALELKGNTFLVSLSELLLKNKTNQEIEAYVSDMIVEGVDLKGLTVTPAAIKSENPMRKTYLNVTVSNLKEQLQKARILRDTFKTIADKINPFAELLEKPLDAFDIDAIVEEQLAEIEDEEEQPDYVYHNFNYLLELSYDNILEKNDNTILEVISSLILEEDMLDLEFAELNHEAVGFNPVSKKLILSVEGVIAILL